jgi:hypothetical protein
MKQALAAHRARTALAVYIAACVIVVLAGKLIVPVDLDTTRAPRPIPVVEVVSILTFVAMAWVTRSPMHPLDACGPRSRIVRFAETVVPAAASVALSLGGAVLLQVRLGYAIQWETIVVNTAIVVGAGMLLFTVAPLEHAAIAVLGGYFGLAILQALLDEPATRFIPLAEMTGPEQWSRMDLVLVALMLLALGGALQGMPRVQIAR